MKLLIEPAANFNWYWEVQERGSDGRQQVVSLADGTLCYTMGSTCDEGATGIAPTRRAAERRGRRAMKRIEKLRAHMVQKSTETAT